MADKFPRYYRIKNTFPNKKVNDKFRTKFKEHSDVSDKLLHDIMKCYGKLFCEEVMNTREGVSLPEMMGVIFIGSSKQRKSVRSYSKYENGEEKRFLNIDTDNRLMKIYYSAYTVNIPFKHYKCWSFKMNKVPRRILAKNFKENWNKYVDTTNLKIKELFAEKRKTTEVKNKEFTFNELDI